MCRNRPPRRCSTVTLLPLVVQVRSCGRVHELQVLRFAQDDKDGERGISSELPPALIEVDVAAEMHVDAERMKHCSLSCERLGCAFLIRSVGDVHVVCAAA